MLGLIGESKKCQKIPWCKKRHWLFELMVIVGVAGELLADGGIFLSSGHLQNITDREIANLQTTNASLVKLGGELNKEAATNRERAAKFELELEKVRSDSMPVQRAISTNGIGIITSKLKLLPSLKVEIARSGMAQESLPLTRQLQAIFSTNGASVVSGAWPSGVQGVWIFWKDGIDWNRTTDWEAKVDIGYAIMRDIKQFQDLDHMFFAGSNPISRAVSPYGMNIPADLRIIVGTRTY